MIKKTHRQVANYAKIAGYTLSDLRTLAVKNSPQRHKARKEKGLSALAVKNSLP